MVSTGPAEAADLPSPEELESAFAKIYELAQQVPFKIRTTEAQHHHATFCNSGRSRRKSSHIPDPGYCRSMKTRDSCSSRTQARCSPAVFFPCLRATCAMTVSGTSTATPNCSSNCAIPPICTASAAIASFVKFAAGQERALMRSAGISLLKIRAVPISPGPGERKKLDLQSI